MTKLNYLIPLALLATGAVNAADNENPWYAGARLGGTHFSNSASSTTDDDDYGLGAFFGFNLTPAIAIETALNDLGDIEFNNRSTINQKTIDFVGKYNWDINENVDFFAKAGAYYYVTESDGFLGNHNDKGLNATAGVGLEYFFNKNVSARLEYQYYNDMEFDASGVNTDWNTHFYGLSLVYNWGAVTPAPIIAAAVVAPVVVEPAPVVVEPAPVVVPEVVAPVVQMIEIEPLTVELPFITNSNKLSQKSLDELAPIAQHLIDYPEAKLFIVGHTDSIGREDYNQQLSVKRAAAVSDYLAVKFNIDKSRIIEEGRGELDPIATNKTAEGRALNRRVSVFTPGLTVESK